MTGCFCKFELGSTVKSLITGQPGKVLGIWFDLDGITWIHLQWVNSVETIRTYWHRESEVEFIK